MRYFSKKTQQGFSLVETLVAVSIVLIVIVGPMTLSSRTAKSSTFATEQVQAYFLAQEGLELVQKARDEYMLEYFKGTESTPWQTFNDNYDATCFTSDGCGLAWDNNSPNVLKNPENCSGIDCKLYLSNSGRVRYNHNSGGEATPFTRKIYFSTTESDREVYVRSEVTWRTGSLIAQQKVVAETYLFNIYALP